jgi:hypothetical protein
VTPGMPVNAPTRFVESASHDRVSPLAVGVSFASVIVPLESWKPTPPPPTKTFVAVSVSVVSLPAESVPRPLPSATFVTSCAEKANVTVPLMTSKRLTVAEPLSAKMPAVSVKLTTTGPPEVGMLSDGAVAENELEPNVPTSCAQSSGVVATVP